MSLPIKQVVRERKFRAGYVVREVVVDGEPFGSPDTPMKMAFTPEGDCIGSPIDAYRICTKRGIRPEKSHPDHSVCSIGWCEREQKWYGWSHRAMWGFAVDYVVEEGTISEWRFPVGFCAETLEDCKALAIAFADSVS